MSDAISIPYRTEDLVPRDGIYGKVMRFAADRPMIAGFAGGMFANMLAFAKSPGVVNSAPGEAALLGLIVLIAWVSLFAMMRSFFEAQSWRTEYVTRLINYNHGIFQWLENDRVVRSIGEPTFEILTRPVPREILDSEKASQQPWAVWIVVSSDDGRFVVETKVAAEEAGAYAEVPDDVVNDVDEALPTHVASPLLVFGRAAAGTL